MKKGLVTLRAVELDADIFLVDIMLCENCQGPMKYFRMRGFGKVGEKPTNIMTLICNSDKCYSFEKMIE